ncbi:MAG: class I SAM-dependent methyltransferase [Gammaproteobacteria bacterium]|nr:class I SAM-dependent methyltransferase [Gammaproteobacteria bacterium]MCP5201877.1 class I SAM-dependent methyltransferase [Gammaproteobacteria bacterium]
MPSFLRHTLPLCALALLAGAGPVSSRAADIPPHVTAAVDDAARWQRDRERDELSRPADILTFAGVEPGMAVLDLFTGGGYWAELFARAVGPTGHVVAHTNTAYRNFAGKLLDARFDDGRVPGVTVHDAEINDLGLGEARFDLVFIGLGYHDLYFFADFSPLPGREWFFGQVQRALKPGGSVVIVDHAAVAGSGATAVQHLHRIDEDYAVADWQRAGFELVARSDVLRNPDDDRSLNVFEDAIRHHTDRFVLRFIKPR